MNDRVWIVSTRELNVANMYLLSIFGTRICGKPVITLDGLRVAFRSVAKLGICATRRLARSSIGLCPFRETAIR